MDRNYYARRQYTLRVRNAIELPGRVAHGFLLQAFVFTGCVVAMQVVGVMYQHRAHWGVEARMVIVDLIAIVNYLADTLRPILEGAKSW